MVQEPEYEGVQSDGGIRRWGRIEEAGEKVLGSSCWPIEKRFTMHFLIDPFVGDDH